MQPAWVDHGIQLLFAEDCAIGSLDAYDVLSMVDRTRASEDEKLISLVGLLSTCRVQAPLVDMLDKMPSRQEFIRRYLATNSPFLARGVLASIPACRKWNPRYLAEICQDVQIKCQAFPRTALTYTTNPQQYEERISFHEFLHTVRKRTARKRYITCHNAILAVPKLKRLWDDFSGRIPLLRVERKHHSEACLWIGPAGTLTPFHHDALNIAFAQIWGRKEVILVPPTELPKLENQYGVFSRLPLAHRPLIRRLREKKVAFDVVTLKGGDLLFLPVSWWHSVTSITASISLSCHKFDIAPRRHNLFWKERFWINR